MNPSDLSEEYGNIKAYCRKEAAKSFKHPMAKHEAPPAEEAAEGEGDSGDMSDSELEELLKEG